MISISDIRSRFPKAELLNDSMVRFEDVTAALKLCYYIEHDHQNDRTLLVVTNGIHSDDLASSLIASSKVVRERGDKLKKLKLIKPIVGHLSHFLVVPASFHNYLRGRFADKRSDLLLLLAICDCEFSGAEDESLFREIRQRWNAAIDPTRKCKPRVLVRFENPKTQGGTIGGNFFPVDLSYLFMEIQNLEGVTDGVLEVQNFRDEVVRVISPFAGRFVLAINHGSSQQFLSFAETSRAVTEFIVS